MQISKASAWQEPQIARFLEQTIVPMRIASIDGEFPAICSVWFVFDEARKILLCVSHQNSQLVKILKNNNRCAFEIAPNEPPYRGIRGKAVAYLTRLDVEQTLNQLIKRYLGDSNDSLGTWLLGRANEEYILEIKPDWITSWDYAHRMEKIED